MDHVEPNPTAPVEHWMRVLESVRFYPQGRDVPSYVPARVEREQALIAYEGGSVTTEAMLAGTWIGERTLRLRNGAVIVFLEATQ